MGLFDTYHEENNSASFSNEDEAYFALLYFAGTIDGNLDKEEVKIFINATKNHYKLKDGDYFKKIMGKVSKIIGIKLEENIDVMGFIVEQALQNIKENHRLSVFINFVNVILADGVIHADEEAAVEKLQKAFQINDEIAMDVVKYSISKQDSFQ